MAANTMIHARSSTGSNAWLPHDLASAALFALFATLPMSFLMPSRIVQCMPATFLGVWLALTTPEHLRVAPRSIGFIADLLVLLLASTISFLANLQEENAHFGFWGGYASAVIIYWAVRGRRIDAKELSTALLVLSASAMVPLVVGVLRYHQMFGIPELTLLIGSRFTYDELEPYRQATWGNVNSTACLLILLMPLFLAQMVDSRISWFQRIWYGSCVLMSGLNLLICGSRASFLLMPLLVGATLYYYRRQIDRTMTMVLFALVGILLIFLSGEGGFFWEYLGSATSTRVEDQSVSERIDAMTQGWNVFWDNPFCGVGPSCSGRYISYGSAHQMCVQHGVEFGIIGFLAISALAVRVLLRWWSVLLISGHQRKDSREFYCLNAAAMFMLMGLIANVATNSGMFNPWLAIFSVVLGLADNARDRRMFPAAQAAQPTNRSIGKTMPRLSRAA